MSTENAANTPVQAQVTEHLIQEIKQDFMDNPSDYKDVSLTNKKGDFCIYKALAYLGFNKPEKVQKVQRWVRHPEKPMLRYQTNVYTGIAKEKHKMNIIHMQGEVLHADNLNNFVDESSLHNTQEIGD